MPLCLLVCAHARERSSRLGGRREDRGCITGFLYTSGASGSRRRTSSRGRRRLADRVQDAMQGGLIDDLPSQRGLVRLLPAQREPSKADRPRWSQATLDANAVASWVAQHGSAPRRQLLRWTALRAASFRLRTRVRHDRDLYGFPRRKPRLWLLVGLPAGTHANHSAAGRAPTRGRRPPRSAGTGSRERPWTAG